MTSSAYIESAAKALPSLTGAGDEVLKKDIDAWIAKVNSGAKDVTDLKVLDRVLANKTFLAGNSISLADLALFSSLHDQVSKLPAAEQYSHLNVTRYFSHISHLASQLPFESATQFTAFDPTFEGQPTIERKDVAAEKQKLKEQKQAAQSAKEASAQAESEGKGEKGGLGAVAVAAGAKKEKKVKGGNGDSANNKEGGKKNKNEPAAPTIPIPSQVDLRVGKIVKIERHPDADSLYLEQVDFGEPDGPRTILSGLVKFVPIEEMQDRWVVGVCNLKPASMRGIKSYGMLLCASKKEDKDAGVAPVRPPEGSEVGDRVYVEGYEGLEPETQMNPKKKIFETIQPNYTTNENFECAWVGAGPQDQENGEKSKRLLRTAKGIVTAPGQVNAMLS